MSGNATPTAHRTSEPVTLAASLGVGFGSAIAAWVAAWILHLPGIDAPARISLPLVILALIAAATFLLRACPARERLRVGAIGGAIAGVANLLIVSSTAVVQPGSTAEMEQYANQFNDQAAIIIPSAVVVCVVAGVVAALLARGGRGLADTRNAWLARLGLVTVFVYLPLIVVGGAVTSTESGMAVPDSVTTYGAISVLFPFELMAHPRIFLEHSHRLFGTLAGLVTLVLMIRVLTSGAGRVAKVLAVVLFIAVCLQGYMGAQRVSERSIPLAIVHGIFGQVVFAMSGTLAAMVALGWRGLDADDEWAGAPARARLIAVVTTVALVLQLMLGAAARHLDHMDPPSSGTGHARLTHAAFAFVVMALLIVLGAMGMRTARSGTGLPVLRRLGIGLHGLVTFQFLLGWAALGLVSTAREPRPIPNPDQLDSAAPIRLGEAIVTTAHQGTAFEHTDERLLGNDCSWGRNAGGSPYVARIYSAENKHGNYAPFSHEPSEA